jgi:hypothetical protein
MSLDAEDYAVTQNLSNTNSNTFIFLFLILTIALITNGQKLSQLQNLLLFFGKTYELDQSIGSLEL